MSAIDEQREAIVRIMRQEIRAHRQRRAVQIFVRIFAVAALVFFAFTFGWYVVPVVPISLFMLAGFGSGIALLLWVTGPAWPKRRRRTPTQ